MDLPSGSTSLKLLTKDLLRVDKLYVSNCHLVPRSRTEIVLESSEDLASFISSGKASAIFEYFDPSDVLTKPVNRVNKFHIENILFKDVSKFAISCHKNIIF